MLPWALLAAGVVLLVLAARIVGRTGRAAAQGLGMLVAAAGGILLLRRPGSAPLLPGHGPRRWHQP